MNHTRLLWLAQRKSDRFIRKNFSSIQIIVAYYILMTVISYLLFCLPIFREPDSHVPFIDLFFLSFFTVSVTGLTTVDINSVCNDRGIVLLEVLFQVGGLGIMMISTVFFILSKRRITLKQRQLIMTDMNQPRLSGIVRLIRTTFFILFCRDFVIPSPDLLNVPSKSNIITLYSFIVSSFLMCSFTFYSSKPLYFII